MGLNLIIEYVKSPPQGESSSNLLQYIPGTIEEPQNVLLNPSNINIDTPSVRCMLLVHAPAVDVAGRGCRASSQIFPGEKTCHPHFS